MKTFNPASSAKHVLFFATWGVPLAYLLIVLIGLTGWSPPSMALKLAPILAVLFTYKKLKEVPEYSSFSDYAKKTVWIQLAIVIGAELVAGGALFFMLVNSRGTASVEDPLVKGVVGMLVLAAWIAHGVVAAKAYARLKRMLP